MKTIHCSNLARKNGVVFEEKSGKFYSSLLYQHCLVFFMIFYFWESFVTSRKVRVKRDFSLKPRKKKSEVFLSEKIHTLLYVPLNFKLYNK